MLIVRDEDDILETVLIHHLNQGVDHVLAIDDESTDGSPDILRSFERSGLLTLVPRPLGSWATDEARWRTLLARQAFTHQRADWVLPTDGDVLWWPLWGNLKDALASVPEACDAIVAPQNDFVITREPRHDVVDELRIREAASPLGEKAVFRGYPDLVVEKGNHRVARGSHADELTRWDFGEQLRVAPWCPLRSFHYGVRTKAALVREAKRHDTRDAVVRWVPRHERTEDPRRFELGAPHREQQIGEGLADGRLVEDSRIADALRGYRDPREEGWIAPQELGANTPGELTAEMTEVQQLVMDALQRRDVILRYRGRTLTWRLEKQSTAARRDPLGRVGRALARVWSSRKRTGAKRPARGSKG